MRRQAGLVCPELLLGTYLSSLIPKPDPMVDNLLIDLAVVKVKIFPEFRRTRP